MNVKALKVRRNDKIILEMPTAKFSVSGNEIDWVLRDPPLAIEDAMVDQVDLDVEYATESGGWFVCSFRVVRRSGPRRLINTGNPVPLR